MKSFLAISRLLLPYTVYSLYKHVLLTHFVQIHAIIQNISLLSTILLYKILHWCALIIIRKKLLWYCRSMFLMLDCLKSELSPLKVLATTWLTHIIQQGDIARVMEPLLQILLHPDTARYLVWCRWRYTRMSECPIITECHEKRHKDLYPSNCMTFSLYTAYAVLNSMACNWRNYHSCLKSFSWYAG